MADITCLFPVNKCIAIIIKNNALGNCAVGNLIKIIPDAVRIIVYFYLI